MLLLNHKDCTNKLLGPHLIIAGPGTGKTTFLIAEIIATLENIKDKNDGIIVCTFTRKATDELLHRIYSKVSVKQLSSINFIVGTIHSICYELLVKYSSNSYSNYQILTEDDQAHFIYSKLKNLGFPSDKIKEAGWSIAEDLASIFNKITDDEINISHLLYEGDNMIEDYCKIYPTYTKLLKYNNLFDFAEIQKTFYDELQNDIVFANEIKKNFKYIFIDEYQDVNNIQDKIFKTVSSPGYNITVVGDDDQSIYGFRGSKVDHMINYKKHFDNLNIHCHTDELLTNHRSTTSIVNCTNYSISLSRDKRIKKNITSDRETIGHKPVLLSFNNDTDEADFYSKLIIVLKDEKIISSYNDISFLFRSLKQHSTAIKKSLIDHKIPYKTSGDGNLFDTPIGMEFMGLVDLYLSKNLDKREKFLDRITYIDILHRTDLISIYKTKGFIANMDDVSNSKKYTSCIELTYDIFKAVDFINRYNSIGQNIGTITSLVLSFDDFADCFDPFGLYGYLSHLRASRKINFIFDENSDAVNLMTIHQSKGLEFPFVFLPSLNNRKTTLSIIDRFKRITSPPSSLIAETDEERRVFYVGLTRAEELLILSHSNTKKRNSPSPFFTELESSPHCIAHLDYDVLKNQKFRNTSKTFTVKKVFSYNKLKLYRFCPLAYKYSSILNLENIRVGNLEFGINVHKILEVILKFIKSGSNVDLIDIKRVIENNWIDCRCSSEDKNENFKHIAYEQITKLISILRQNLTVDNIFSVEDEFNVFIDDCLITGRFNAVLNIQNTLTIIDFNTGDFRNYIDQLSFYSLCFQKKYGIQNVRTAIFYLQQGIIEYIKPMEHKKINDIIVSITKNINNNIFIPKSGKHCEYCAYLTICASAL